MTKDLIQAQMDLINAQIVQADANLDVQTKMIASQKVSLNERLATLKNQLESE